MVNKLNSLRKKKTNKQNEDCFFFTKFLSNFGIASFLSKFFMLIYFNYKNYIITFGNDQRTILISTEMIGLYQHYNTTNSNLNHMHN